MPCPRCTRLVEVAWPVCPWCVAELPWRREPVPVMAEPREAPTVWPDWGAAATTADASATPDGPPADETEAPEPATTGSSGRSSTAIW